MQALEFCTACAKLFKGTADKNSTRQDGRGKRSMSNDNEDDKPTVVLDLNALKKQKQKEEENLANIGTELEFAVDIEATKTAAKPAPKSALRFPVILFDFESDFFQKSRAQFPQGFDYKICKTVNDLTTHLKNKNFQIVVFNYDANPKAVNQLSAQIKQKFASTKVMIVAKAISPEKAKLHAQTPAGASGYFQLPLDAGKLQAEFQKIHDKEKKVG